MDKPVVLNREIERRRAVWKGIFLANLAGMLQVGLATLVSRLNQPMNQWTPGEFLVVPFLIGIIGRYYWRDAKPSGGQNLSYCLAAGIGTLLLSVIFFGEGGFCVIIAAPLVIAMICLGSAVTYWIFERAERLLRVSVIPLLLAWLFVDAALPHHFESSVTDTVTIHASPARVWNYLAAYPKITDPPDYWLWRLGLPYPLQSMAIGDDRECVFTRGVSVGERIIVRRPGRELTFLVTRQPRNPEIARHFVLKQGQFLLHDNGDGTTALTGTSWYGLNVGPTAYFDLWTKDIIRHVHWRVMGRIKALAEGGA